jgi:hypothetical protein
VRDPSWDKNSSANAFEVINAHGVPVFQMIRRDDFHIEFNGIFPLPGGGFLVADSNGISDRLEGYAPKVIFKYPSWKYPGQYAD